MRADGSIDARRYPAFGGLPAKARGTRVRRPFHEYTTQAVPSIVTGNAFLGAAHCRRLRTIRAISSRCSASRTRSGREPVTRLCPVTYCPNHRSAPARVPCHRTSPRRRDQLSPRLAAGRLSRETSRPCARAGVPCREHGSGHRRVRASGQRSNPPRTLYFLHTMQPHAPWSPCRRDAATAREWFVSGLRRLVAGRASSAGAMASRCSSLRVSSDTSSRSGYLDRFVADLLGRLDETGLYDRALVIVTADHGVSFRPGGWRRHVTAGEHRRHRVSAAFVKYPGQTRGREDRRAAADDRRPADGRGRARDPPSRGSVDGRSLRAHDRRDASSEVGCTGRARQSWPPTETTSRRRSCASLDATRRSSEKGTDSLYRLGPRPELLGRTRWRRASMRGLSARTPRSSLPDAGRARRTSAGRAGTCRRTSSGASPGSRCEAERGSSRSPINGRIAAVTTPFARDGRDASSLRLSTSGVSFGQPNTVEVFAVRGRSAATRLVELGGVGLPAPSRE